MHIYNTSSPFEPWGTAVDFASEELRAFAPWKATWTGKHKGWITWNVSNKIKKDTA